MDRKGDTIAMEQHSTINKTADTEYSRPLVSEDSTTSDLIVVSKSLHTSPVIDLITKVPEFSSLVRYYNLLYQSLIPNCKLTIKILKQHLEIPSDVESFIINGESSRIRCQRIINLLLVQLNTTRDYKQFCYLFNMVSVVTFLPDKLRKGDPYKEKLVPLSNNQLDNDNYVIDNIITRCFDEGPSDDKASHHHVVGRKRCYFRIVSTAIKEYEGISPTSPSTIPVDSSIQELSVDLVERSLSQPTRSSSTSVTVSQSSNTDSEVVTSTIFKQEGDGSAVTTDMLQKSKLEEHIKRDHSRQMREIKCPQPPPLPSNYVLRQQLLDEMITKLCQSTVDPNSYGTTLTVTGAGGFGKTSLVTALCHHPAIKEQFKDGCVFVALGPQEINPNMKLKGLYSLLTNEPCDINVVEQQMNELTSLYCRNLLVIIDDVWHVEDAEPIVKAFSSCKIVLTTRINDIDKYIPTKQVVSVGPMEQTEALSLLTCKMIDVTKLSQEDMKVLYELAQDVHLWPLLLSLVRGHLSHNLKRQSYSFHEAIKHVEDKLHDKGLTAFDKNSIGGSRKYAVKVCVAFTLELLTKNLSDKMKTLILYTGIASFLQTAVLHILWDITEQDTNSIVDALWSYGLIQYTDINISPHNHTQRCVEVHSVISQYIIEDMESEELISLSPYGRLNTHGTVLYELRRQFHLLHGSSLSVTEYLKYRLNEIENVLLPCYFKQINMFAVTDPHYTIVLLKQIQSVVLNSPNITAFFPSIIEQMNSLISECQTILKDVYKSSRKLNQQIQQYITKMNYDELIKKVEIYMNTYRIGLISQQVVTMIKEVILYCDEELLHEITDRLEFLQMRTPDYHDITLQTLPFIKLHTRLLQEIATALSERSDNIQELNKYFAFGNYNEEYQMVHITRLIQLQTVAPNWLSKVHHDVM